ncbi:immunity protein Imm33 domain-containing protein [Chryseobacterium sp. JK1]|uniref:immunity protein Imm33 domain-containing protein n=1 Tax=Chryseobacterium sp. JK1 TaxID=874294 RepID=UPI003D68885A
MGFFSRNKTFKIRDIEFYSEGNYHYSKGLQSSITKEIKIAKNNLSLEQLQPILQYLVEFIQDEKPDIKSGEKTTCFSWCILFHEEPDAFEILEVIPEQGGFGEGLSRTLHLLHQQLSVCNQLKVEPDFPDFDHIVAIDPLIQKGLQPNLFRWKAEDPDSGWVVMSNSFNEETMSFEEMTVGQLMTMRPEIAQFMALPAGFKVISQGNNVHIAFDKHLTEN